MRFTQPGQSEAAVAAHFEYLCAIEGAQRPAYVPVVASGYVLIICSYLLPASNSHTLYVYRANALTIHYTANNQMIQPQELVLVDAGCEYKLVAFLIRDALRPNSMNEDGY